MCVCMHLVAQSCLILCDLMDCSLRGHSVHEILWERILEWVAIPFSSGSTQPRSPALQVKSLPSERLGKPRDTYTYMLLLWCYYLYSILTVLFLSDEGKNWCSWMNLKNRISVQPPMLIIAYLFIFWMFLVICHYRKIMFLDFCKNVRILTLWILAKIDIMYCILILNQDRGPQLDKSVVFQN